MAQLKKVIAICGSTKSNSSNLKLLKYIAAAASGIFDLEIFDRLAQLPHFNPDIQDTPAEITALRNKISAADGIIICTPEYIFSLPGSLKNVFEWCVATTIFAHKPAGLIVASASGEKAREELMLIMKTLEAKFTPETEILIKGIAGKINATGDIGDKQTLFQIDGFIDAFDQLLTHDA
jgi:chromate reductase, NAD(P)H dehydrogenase (quinone)